MNPQGLGLGTILGTGFFSGHFRPSLLALEMVTLWPREGPEELLGFWPPTQDSTVSSVVSEQSLPCPGIMAWRGVIQPWPSRAGPGQGIERPWNRKAFGMKEGEVWVLGVP